MGTFLSGDRLTAARAGRIQPTTYHAIASDILTRTNTTKADIPGATATFTTETTFANALVIASFDSAVGTLSTTTDMVGFIDTDGITEADTARHQMDITDRDTVVATTWTTLTSPGSHTIKLQGALSAAAGSGTFQVFTSITVVVFEVP